MDEDDNISRMVKLRNPWGNTEWEGRGSERDQGFWARIKESREKAIFLGRREPNDGIFFMEYEDFCHYFNEVHICHLL